MTKAPRPIRIEGDIAYIPLTQGYEAVIDAADVPLVEGRNWHARIEDQRVYAATMSSRRDGPRQLLYLHAVLTGFPLTDHRDGNGLINRRLNLREATKTQNACNSRRSASNTSGFKGVAWHKASGCWQAYINQDGKRRPLGLFDTAEAAHAAYTEASENLHGDFGRAA